MADDNTIIEGTVKFRDGKKWKSRWCVMRKLSPVADCVQLQLYRDARGRRGGAGGCKAALSLQHYLGCELGFTLDKHSNTLALVCRDLVAVLAFETRERLIQWQVKVSAHLGEPRPYLVLVGASGAAGAGAGAGAARLAPGPARLHLHERRCALTAGVPPRLLGVWELPHLRRYGVVEGRFCFEGGSYCGKGEGLHVLITDQAKEIAADFDLASQGRLSPKRRPLNSTKFNEKSTADSPNSHKVFRADTRLSELNTIDGSLRLAEFRSNEEEACGGIDTGAVSPYWPSAERSQDLGLGDTASVHEDSAAAHVALERCRSCMSKLGALSRSSTAALTPGGRHFSPAWTMDALEEAFPDTGPAAADGAERPPAAPTRPPKPTHLDLNLGRKPPMPLPSTTCRCSCPRSAEETPSNKIGPYENYDVPKLASVEVDAEYYDTPKRLKECLNNELFKMTKSSTADALIMKKPCGCLLKFGRRREAAVVDSDERVQPASCPCRRVTDWANSWIRLPYCRRNASSDSLAPNKENMKPDSDRGDRGAIYATIDVSRKTRRKTHPIDPGELYHSVDPQKVEIDRGPLANYENLNFALSLEYYENAKDLLRRAGVTQSELDAIGANLRGGGAAAGARALCAECGHPPARGLAVGDDYLMMEPKSLECNKQDQCRSLPPGYTPMSPLGGFAFNTLKLPARSPASRLLDEKSASNPTLHVPEAKRPSDGSAHAHARERRPPRAAGDRDRVEYRKRSSSADSSRFLEDVKEFEGAVGSRGSGSSIETLRDAERPPAGAPDHKLSDADSSEASKGGGGGGCAAQVRAAGAGPAGNRDSSSSNDSGVSSCSLRRHGGEFELPATTAAARRHYRSARRAAAPRGAAAGCCPPRRSRSTDPLRDGAAPRNRSPAKSSSAEAEVPLLAIIKPFRGAADTHSTSSGASDMSDYIETLSICSSHSSSDTPVTMRVARQTSTLRPRSGKEYGSLDPRLTSVFRASRAPHRPPSHLYSNLP